MLSKKMFQIKAKVIYNNRVKDNYFRCGLFAPTIANKASPGQFLNIKLTNDFSVLLRRPFSIHKISGSKAEIIYEVVGRGTEILSQKKSGEYLDMIGPLGNGFNYVLYANRYALLVAGGMGVAPLMFLAERLAYSVERRVHSKKLSAKRYPLNAIVLIGAKDKNHILCEKEFKDLGCDVKIATDDGSRGFKGYVSEMLDNLLSAKRYPLSAIYACGPRPMLKEISTLSKKYNIPAQISLEEHMACGIGACLGCVVNTRDGFKRVCKDGPVFTANQIIWGKCFDSL